jgi:hypothetical protein
MEVVQGRQAQCLPVTHWDGHSQGRRDQGNGASGRCLLSCLFFGKQGEPGDTEAAAPGLLCCEGLQSVTLSLVCVSTRAIAAAQGLRDYREVLFYPMHDLPNSAVKPLNSFMGI